MYLLPLTQRLVEEYGEPVELEYSAEFSEREFGLLLRCARTGRAHDVTLFIADGPRLALIRKPSYPPGLFRPPSGGVEVGEPVAVGAAREAQEETGLAIRLTRFLLRVRARFSCRSQAADWTTYVFAADALTRTLDPGDRREIAEACWATPEALQAIMRPRMLAVGSAGFRYRVFLQDAGLIVMQRDGSVIAEG